jgi:hypothetical protein
MIVRMPRDSRSGLVAQSSGFDSLYELHESDALETEQAGPAFVGVERETCMA